MFSLGLKNYFRRSIYKFEFMLAVGTTIHCFPPFYRTTFTYFQGLRVARLLKSSPLLENFIYKVFSFVNKYVFGYLFIINYVDFWSRKESWQFDSLYNVFTINYFVY